MFYKQVVLHRGLPFDVKLPASRPVDMSKLTEDQLRAEIQKGYEDVLAGRTKPADQVFAEIRKDYGL